MTDLDQSGNYAQVQRVYLGPSLGWVDARAMPQQTVSSAGTTTLVLGASIVFVDVNGSVTLNLPDVAQWMKVVPFNPGTVWGRELWIKDLGGHAAAFPISVVPFGAQAIDKLAQTFSILQNRQLLRLYPLNDLSGWFSG